MNNFTIDKQPKLLYIINMMNDDFRDMMPTSEEFYADAKAEFGEVVEEDQPKGVCEDAPCCGCCDAPSYDEVAENYAADAWHDAHEYPEW